MEPLGVARAPDDVEPQSLASGGTQGDVALVTGIREQVLEPGEALADLAADQRQAVTVLEVGRMQDQPQRQAQRVGEQMPLAPVDLLAGVEAARAPASVVLTLWLSMIAAVGDASRPDCSRAAMSRLA